MPNRVRRNKSILNTLQAISHVHLTVESVAQVVFLVRTRQKKRGGNEGEKDTERINSTICHFAIVHRTLFHFTSETSQVFEHQENISPFLLMNRDWKLNEMNQLFESH